MKTAPFSKKELNEALLLLPQPVSKRAAAFHLALPVDKASSIALRLTPKGWTYKGFTVSQTDDPVRDAVKLTEIAHQEEDFYLDLEEDLSTWVKAIHSGTRIVLFGTDVLFGMPLVTLGKEVNSSSAKEVVKAYLDKRHPQKEFLQKSILTKEGFIRIKGTKDQWVLEKETINKNQ